MNELKFDAIEVHGVRDHGEWAEVVKDADADFFGLFGRVGHGDNACYIAIGDFESRPEAEFAQELLDNKKKGGLPQP